MIAGPNLSSNLYDRAMIIATKSPLFSGVICLHGLGIPRHQSARIESDFGDLVVARGTNKTFKPIFFGRRALSNCR